MNRPQGHFVPLFVIAVLLLGASDVRTLLGAQPPPMINKEPEIRAGLVALQPKLWTWPPAAAPRAGAPHNVGILGEDPFQLAQKLAANNNVKAVNFANAAAIKPCHILVVSPTTDLQAALKAAGAGVLVIGQAPGLAQQGAVLNLPVKQNKVQIEINMIEAKKAGLKPDPGLIRAAAEVIK